MPFPPETLEQLLRRLQEARPDLCLDDPDRPVVLVSAGANDVRRALVCDADVHKYFAACDKEGVLELEVHDLFPNGAGEKERRFVALPVSYFVRPQSRKPQESPQKPPESPQKPPPGSPPRRPPGSPPQRPPGSQPQRGAGGSRGTFRRHKDTAATAPAPLSPPELQQPPRPQSPTQRPLQGGELEEMSARPTLAPRTPQPVQAAPVMPSPPPVRPSSAPPTSAPRVGVKQVDGTASTAKPGNAALDEKTPCKAEKAASDERPNCQAEEPKLQAEAEPFGIHAKVAELFTDIPPGPKSGALQSDSIDVAHLRGKYEHLWFESGRKRVALDWLLRARDTTPGLDSLNLYREPAKGSAARASSATPRRTGKAAAVSLPVKKPAFLDVGKWDEGEYCTVKDADVPALQEALNSFKQINGSVTGRLEVEEASSTKWSIGAARRRLVLDNWPHMTKPHYLPRRIMIESPWMPFEGIEVSFRLYPCGDGSAKPGDSSVYIWTSQPPGFSFTWNLRIEGSMDTTPRLWSANCQRSRVFVKWSKLEVALLKLPPQQDHLEICFRVLQWHGPEDDPSEWLPEHHTSTSLALQVLQWTGSAGG